jgi:hypothetical protein
LNPFSSPSTYICPFDSEKVYRARLSFGIHQSELASRSAGPTMDKTTFLRFFNLPGMMGERLFQVCRETLFLIKRDKQMRVRSCHDLQVFDRKQNGVIEWEEFVAGLSDFCRGSLDEKIMLLFRMYDLTGDGHVSKEEFRTMLYSLVRIK